MSRDSAASVECRKELVRAVELNKRIIPVNVRATLLPQLPEELARRQFVPGRSHFDEDFDQLISGIETDFDWVQADTALGDQGDRVGRAPA
jgi:hypothetical protein